MALVAYDYSSDSDGDNITDEENDAPSQSKVIINQKTNETTTTDQPHVNGTATDTPSNTNSLFSQLPEARANSSPSQMTEEDDKLEDFIPTVKTLKEKKKVQITIPSLSDFDDLEQDEPVKKKPKPSQKGSGLLGILPPVQSAPMSNTMFVPKTVQMKNEPARSTTTSKSLIPDSVKKAQANKKSSTVVKKVTKPKTGSDDSDSDNDDIPVPDTFDDQMWEKICGRPKPTPIAAKVDMTAPEPEPELSSAPEPQKPYDGLDNQAFKELVGKTKRPIGNIKLIDIHESEIMPDKDLWMTKSLTDPDLAPRPQPQETLDPTKKRKHHITYLAQQAKANEQELKSAWATGRNNRMMSRSKYGF